jgi:hypothetical protein
VALSITATLTRHRLAEERQQARAHRCWILELGRMRQSCEHDELGAGDVVKEAEPLSHRDQCIVDTPHDEGRRANPPVSSLPSLCVRRNQLTLLV